MPGCFVVNCKTGYKGRISNGLFRLKKAEAEIVKNQWIANIPQRVGVKFDHKLHRICYRHFHSDFLVTQVLPASNNVSPRKMSTTHKKSPQKGTSLTTGTKSSQKRTIPTANKSPQKHKKWKLLKGAYPTEFPGLPSYYTKPLPRKSPTPRASVVVTHKRPKVTVFNRRFDRLIKEIPDASKHFAGEWYINVSHTGDKFIKAYRIQKEGPAESIWSDLTMTITSNLSPTLSCRDKSLHVPIEYGDNFTLISAINRVQDIRTCNGIQGFDSSRPVKESTSHGGRWISTLCTGLAAGDISDYCDKCKIILRRLRVQVAKSKKSEVRERMNSTPSTYQSAVSSIKFLRRRLTKVNYSLRHTRHRLTQTRLELKVMNKKFMYLDEKKMELCINDCPNLSPLIKQQLQTSIKNAKAGSPCGRRYEHDWLLECLLLKIKSNEAYEYLRSKNMMPLPHPSSLRRLIRGVPCEFGVHKFVLARLKEDFAKLKPRDRQCGLVFDEVKVRESIDYDKVSWKLNGFVDFGSYTQEYKDKTKKASLVADHALVFMVRSMNSNLCQPVAVFASSGAAPGWLLSKLMLSVLLELEEAGVQILFLTCDGSTSNKSFWKTFGIKGKKTQVVNRIVHPADDKRNLHFVSDVPHIFKCVRNHMLKHKNLKYESTNISYYVYENVFRLEEALPPGIKTAMKISKAHIYPNSFQKMRVKLATQLFSNTMASTINFYHSTGKLRSPESQATRKFTKDMNDVFDALNTNRVNNNLKYNDHHHNMIRRFLVKLMGSTENTFASDVTMESLIVTLQSTLDMIEILVMVLGFNYVLTYKFNQDCIERFFGIMRQIGGGDDHPSVNTFLQLFRLLSIYFPLMKILRGNTTETGERETVVSNCFLFFSEGRKERSINLAERKSDACSKIIDKVFTNVEPTSLGMEFAECRITRNNIYNLCGFLAFKRNCFYPCVRCQESLFSNCPLNYEDSQLTLMKSRGNLCHPSLPLFKLILLYIEPVITKILKERPTDAEPSVIIDELNDFPTDGLSCGEESHHDTLIPEILIYYISFRLDSFCSQRRSSSEKRVQQKRKEVKL